MNRVDPGDIDPTIDDFVAMYKNGDFKKVAVIVVLSEGGIQEFVFTPAKDHHLSTCLMPA